MRFRVIFSVHLKNRYTLYPLPQSAWIHRVENEIAVALVWWGVNVDKGKEKSMERGREDFVVSDGKAMIVKVVVITGKKRKSKMVVLDGNCNLLTRLVVEEGV